AAARNAPGRMSAMATFTPARASVRAIPSPIPLAPPVTNATLPATSRIEGLHGKFCGPVTDGRHPGLRFATGLEAFDVLGHGSEQRVCFQESQHSAHTGVDAVSPPEVCAMIATDVEAIGVLPFARIAVGGGKHEAAPLPLRDNDAFDLDVA